MTNVNFLISLLTVKCDFCNDARPQRVRGDLDGRELDGDGVRHGRGNHVLNRNRFKARIEHKKFQCARRRFRGKQTEIEKLLKKSEKVRIYLKFKFLSKLA